MRQPQRPQLLVVSVLVLMLSVAGHAEESRKPLTYRQFEVDETDERVLSMTPMAAESVPCWARDVSQEHFDWARQSTESPFFSPPIPFVVPPIDEEEPFYQHNHQPSITWLANGDLLAIWYSTRSEYGPVLTVVASRLRSGEEAWDPCSEFFKAHNHNMHGSSIFHDGHGTIYHFNGMAPKARTGWKQLALLMRSSTDNGVTWTAPKAIDRRFIARHQVISGTLMTRDGVLIQNCDAVPGGNGGTALHISHDRGKTWADPGEGKPAPIFTEGGKGEGTIAGIHAKVVELSDGRLLALGRGDAIDDRMPMSLSADLGKTWTYQASPFPTIGGGQRLVLKRLQEGSLLFASFTSGNRSKPEANSMTFANQEGRLFTGHGMYAAVSFDDGKTWPVRKLLTPGNGEYDGGAWTRQFTATPTRAEHAGYLAATQTPDGVIHLISSRLHYRFNLPWLLSGTKAVAEGSSGKVMPFTAHGGFGATVVENKNRRLPYLRARRDKRALVTRIPDLKTWPETTQVFSDLEVTVAPNTQWAFNLHRPKSEDLTNLSPLGYLEFRNIGIQPGDGAIGLKWGSREYNAPDRRFIDCDYTDIPKEHGLYVSNSGNTLLERCTFLRVGSQGAQWAHRPLPYQQYFADNAPYKSPPSHVVRDCHFVDCAYRGDRPSFNLTYFSPGTSENPGTLLVEDSSFVCKWDEPRIDNPSSTTPKARYSTGAIVVTPGQGSFPLDPRKGQMMKRVSLRNCLFDYTAGDRAIMELRSVDEIVIEECCFIARNHTQNSVNIDCLSGANSILNGTKSQRLVLRNNLAENVVIQVGLRDGTRDTQFVTIPLHTPDEEVIYSAVTGREISRKNLRGR